MQWQCANCSHSKQQTTKNTNCAPSPERCDLEIIPAETLRLHERVNASGEVVGVAGGCLIGAERYIAKPGVSGDGVGVAERIRGVLNR